MANKQLGKVLITGINGFIASHIAERCIAEGLKVKGLGRRLDEANWLAKKGVELINGDLLEAEAMQDIAYDCDIVIHAAGWSGGNISSADLAWKTNVDGTANVLKSAKLHGVKRFIYISSVAVYGMNNAPVIDESMPTPLINELYPDSKITAEQVVREFGMPYVIIRPGCIYGPRGEGWTIGIINQIKNGLKLLGNDDGLITTGYISNFVDGVWLAMTKDEAIGHIFNICDDKAITYRKFYMSFANMLKITELPTVPVCRVKLSQSKLFALLRVLLRKPSNEKYAVHFRFNKSGFSIKNAEVFLKYKPKITFDDGVIKTENWLKENGYLS